MKKIDNVLLLVGVVIIIAALGFLFVQNRFGKPDPAPTLKPSTIPTKAAVKINYLDIVNDSTALTEVLKNSEVILPEISPEVKVKLVNGTATYKSGEDLQNISFISIVGMNPVSNGNYDVFASYAANFGGSGSFVYVGLNHITPEEITYTSSTDFLGDRIKVETATASAMNVNDYTLTVNYLDRKTTDSMADAPTVPVSKEFNVVEDSIQK